MIYTDTIAAISTPRGTGGVAMIRITGAESIAIAARVFFPASGLALTEAEHSRAYHGKIRRCGRVIDDGVATVFRGPRSYTGEDTVEITCHGGVLVTQEVLTSVLESGARQAEAGEFTRRAFAAGKLTLSEAEAVGDLIHARTHSQLALSAGSSRLSREVEEIADDLTSLIARVSVRLDYPEEDLADIDNDELAAECGAIEGRLSALGGTYRTGRAVADGVNAVICGRPNAGKSTLYNLFVGDDAAIVTDVAGTTRDTLTTDAVAGRVLLHLSDTAGIRHTDDAIESIGVGRARDKIAGAELLIVVLDSSHEPSEEDAELLLPSDGCVKFAVINKLDRADVAFADEYEALARDHGARAIRASLAAGRGFDELVRAIEDAFTDGKLTLGQDAVVANARQSAEIESSSRSMASALSALANSMPIDVVVCELQDALSALARLCGRDVGEDVIGEIFGKFCVGK